MSEKLKNFLQQKIKECEIVIKKRKRKNNLIKGLFVTSITISMVGGSIVLLLSSISVAPIAVACISGMSTLSTALSIKFNLQNKKDKLNKNIQDLNKVKDKLDYVISCNGDLSEIACNKILDEFRTL